jgi:hypothetical protein
LIIIDKIYTKFNSKCLFPDTYFHTWVQYWIPSYETTYPGMNLQTQVGN